MGAGTLALSYLSTSPKDIIQMTLATRSVMNSIISSSTLGLGLPLTAIYSGKVGPTFC